MLILYAISGENSINYLVTCFNEENKIEFRNQINLFGS